MSRSGYSDDCENLEMYRGAVRQAIKGKRGQRALVEIVTALDAMPCKELVSGSFSKGGSVCTLGVLAASRGVDVSDLEPNKYGERDSYYWDEVDTNIVGKRLDIAYSMAAEVMYENDEHHSPETPAERWTRMRKWAESKIKGAA